VGAVGRWARPPQRYRGCRGGGGGGGGGGGRGGDKGRGGGGGGGLWWWGGGGGGGKESHSIGGSVNQGSCSNSRRIIMSSKSNYVFQNREGPGNPNNGGGRQFLRQRGDAADAMLPASSFDRRSVTAAAGRGAGPARRTELASIRKTLASVVKDGRSRAYQDVFNIPVFPGRGPGTDAGDGESRVVGRE